MSNMTRRSRPSLFNLRRDVDEALEDFTSPHALRREIERLFGEDLSPRSLWNEMDRLLQDFVTPMSLRNRIGALFEPFTMGMGMGMGMGVGVGVGGIFVPDIELMERDNEYLLTVDLPGVSKENVQVSVDDNNILTIRGERREEQRSQERGYEYSERGYGIFTRSVELPRSVDTSRIDAEYSDGVLRLHIPRSEQAAARRISVRGRELGGREREIEGSRSQGQSQAREQPRVMEPSSGNERRDEKPNQRTQVNSR